MVFARWHLGQIKWDDALRSGGIVIKGPSELRSALPKWNRRPEMGERLRATQGNARRIAEMVYQLDGTLTHPNARRQADYVSNSAHARNKPASLTSPASRPWLSRGRHHRILRILPSSQRGSSIIEWNRSYRRPPDTGTSGWVRSGNASRNLVPIRRWARISMPRLG